MAVRKSVEDTFVVSGRREEWFTKCKNALSQGGFTGIQANDKLFQLKGNFKKWTVWDSLEVTMMPEGDNTKIVAKATANVDNIFALFSSPGPKIIEAFKSNIA